ncbi:MULTISPECIES: alpha/beta fold hydrolase [unclassified Herbaspirillum]|uniref:alpha/beta fold hydrolase n=1 Tax=unclassified Herbaspirillum TaxID=2624150 RepID=UPI00115192D7|nr:MULTISPECIES: alpha/beta hydrolase [unclassified Herbaspirillum]MBB5391933.1 pimeloyl-ACP methyl ester carboxylesterase [Herbaspirillum sp. SJZ102]TQK13393.1 alpha-beta hydrolase superfamily lysophospholipase [Herbaspirillum sp. SJZ130]TQK15397.1 alpha-beta hydrolase superfamily lysophospholipase [Herbaspirillum sp. SJZ106]TWC71292.1 alpha-beta hydrolase superfamily lysophospholipase [Herbaspirillum sp. SJZ099]
MTQPGAHDKPSRSEFLQVRGLRYHVRHWGDPGAPKLFMLHGWMDVSASFQFMVDALQGDWHVIAPDWRGFGLSERTHADSYWFPDYLADLDAILAHYAGAEAEEAVDLLGHSMGGNVATLYAGVRPQRIRRLINLEGLGLPSARAEQAPGRFAQWMDEVRNRPLMRGYDSLQEVAARLQKNNVRLSDERAAFLAPHWAAQDAAGLWQILGDPAHKQVSPILYRVDEMMACWSQITAPVLWVEAKESDIWRFFGQHALMRDEIDRRIGFIPKVQVEMIGDAGHMLHHDQPELLAALVERFLARPA